MPEPDRCPLCGSGEGEFSCLNCELPIEHWPRIAAMKAVCEAAEVLVDTDGMENTRLAAEALELAVVAYRKIKE